MKFTGVTKFLSFTETGWWEVAVDRYFFPHKEGNREMNWVFLFLLIS
jgi:hypothetical protein